MIIKPFSRFPDFPFSHFINQLKKNLEVKKNFFFSQKTKIAIIREKYRLAKSFEEKARLIYEVKGRLSCHYLCRKLKINFEKAKALQNSIMEIPKTCMLCENEKAVTYLHEVFDDLIWVGEKCDEKSKQSRWRSAKVKKLIQQKLKEGKKCQIIPPFQKWL